MVNAGRRRIHSGLEEVNRLNTDTDTTRRRRNGLSAETTTRRREEEEDNLHKAESRNSCSAEHSTSQLHRTVVSCSNYSSSSRTQGASVLRMLQGVNLAACNAEQVSKESCSTVRPRGRITNRPFNHLRRHSDRRAVEYRAVDAFVIAVFMSKPRASEFTQGRRTSFRISVDQLWTNLLKSKIGKIAIAIANDKSQNRKEAQGGP